MCGLFACCLKGLVQRLPCQQTLFAINMHMQTATCRQVLQNTLPLLGATQPPTSSAPSRWPRPFPFHLKMDTQSQQSKRLRPQGPRQPPLRSQAPSEQPSALGAAQTASQDVQEAEEREESTSLLAVSCWGSRVGLAFYSDGEASRGGSPCSAWLLVQRPLGSRTRCPLPALQHPATRAHPPPPRRPPPQLQCMETQDDASGPFRYQILQLAKLHANPKARTRQRHRPPSARTARSRLQWRACQRRAPNCGRLHARQHQLHLQSLPVRPHLAGDLLQQQGGP